MRFIFVPILCLHQTLFFLPRPLRRHKTQQTTPPLAVLKDNSTYTHSIGEKERASLWPNTPIWSTTPLTVTLSLCFSTFKLLSLANCSQTVFLSFTLWLVLPALSLSLSAYHITLLPLDLEPSNIFVCIDAWIIIITVIFPGGLLELRLMT